jgi:hypothetical protein
LVFLIQLVSHAFRWLNNVWCDLKHIPRMPKLYFNSSFLFSFRFGFQLNSQNVSFYGWIPIYQSNQFVVFVFEEKILKCIFICLNIKKSEGKIHLQIVLLYVYWVWDKQMEIYRFSFLSDFTGMKVKFITPKKRILKTEKL